MPPEDFDEREKAQAEPAREKAVLKLLQAITVAANESASIDDTLRFSLGKICRYGGWSLGHVYLCPEDESKELISTALWHVESPRPFEPFREATEIVRFRRGEGLPGRVWAVAKPEWLRYADESPHFLRAKAAKACRIKAALASPVLIAREVVAILEFFSEKALPPEDDLLDVLGIIGTQLGRAVERQRSLDATQRAYHEIERQVAERTQELRQAKRQLEIQRQMIDQVAIVSETDAQGRILFVNDKFCEISKFSREELLGKDHRIINSGRHPKAFWKEFWETIAQGKLWRGEVCNKAKDGTLYWVDAAAVPFLGDDGKIQKYLSIRFVITERKKAEAMARAAEKLSTIGQLAAGVAHEINNPLGVILGFAQGAMRRVEAGTPLEMAMKSIERESLRCKTLVQELLAFSRTSQGEGRVGMDLNEAVERTMTLVTARAKTSRAEVRKNLTPNLCPMLGNADQIQQIVINLATNAMDAMGDSGGALTIATEIVREEGKPWVRLSVSDAGPGIPADALPHIFEPFFTTKPVGKGTGLGLYLIHEIVVKHEGSIHVETRPGFTEFAIRFPCAA